MGEFSEVPEESIEDVIKSASEKLDDNSIEFLANKVRSELEKLKSEVQKDLKTSEELEIEKRDPLRYATTLVEYADSLRSNPSTQEYLSRSGKIVSLASRLPFSMHDDHAIVVKADGVWIDAHESNHTGIGGDGRKSNQLDAGGLKWQWDKGNKFWVNKLTGMNRVGIISKFQETLKV